jgi:zinc D-Ala-D-Ala carboxypeptidase
MSKHFEDSEFACHCCGQNEVKAILIKMLEQARLLYGRPMVIMSGYRCPDHNQAVGGKPDSAHLKGLAADVRCATSQDRYQMVQAFLSVGVNRIGIGKDFVHVDVARDLPQNVIWTYY